jgi:hypothetical protein
MRDHVRIVAILHIVFGALGVLAGLLILGLLGGIGSVVAAFGQSPDAEIAAPILTLIGGFVCVLLLVLSVPGIVGGAGLLKYQPWARILMIVISALDLLNFPFGTALGVYGLWVLLQTETERLFVVQRV